MSMFRCLGSVALVAGFAAAPAAAQSFDGRISFRSDHLNSNTPNIEQFQTPQVPGQYNFTVMVGAFESQGFTNQGLFNWVGGMTVTGGPATLSLVGGNRAPFTLNGFGNGILSPDGRSITRMDTARSPYVDLPWPEGAPMPTPPAFTQGNDQYFPAYRFALNLTDLDFEGDITVTASGLMQSIRAWALLSGGEGEEATFFGSSYVTDPSVTGSFTIHVPAPAGLAAMGLGCLAAVRRRRSGNA